MSLRVVVGFLCIAVSAFGQQAEQPTPPIRVQVNEVIVPVTVTDDKGRFISNLEQKDFQVLEQGKPQSIEFFSRERNQPVVVGFLLDLSNSSRAQWKNFQGAARKRSRRYWKSRNGTW
jgi:VWFA-related protein